MIKKMIDFLKKTYRIFVLGIKQRIIPNSIACLMLGAGTTVPNHWLRALLIILGALILAETWYQFGYNKAMLINTLRKK